MEQITAIEQQSTEALLLEMCRMMKGGNIRLKVYDDGNSMEIEWNDTFVTENREATARLSDLFYKIEDTVILLSKLEDGVYGPVELWHRFMN